MDKEKLVSLLRAYTNEMFSSEFYEKLSSEIIILDSAKEKSSGFVYFIRTKNDAALMKIGKAQNIQKRLFQMNTALSSPIVLVGYIESENYSKIEKELHSAFQQQRVKGEWFKINLKDVMDRCKDTFTPVGSFLGDILFENGEIVNFKKTSMSLDVANQCVDNPDVVANFSAKIEAKIMELFFVPKEEDKAYFMTATQVKEKIEPIDNVVFSKKSVGVILKRNFGRAITRRLNGKPSRCYLIGVKNSPA